MLRYRKTTGLGTRFGRKFRSRFISRFMLSERSSISMQGIRSIGAKRRLQNQIYRLFEIKFGLSSGCRHRSSTRTGMHNAYCRWFFFSNKRSNQDGRIENSLKFIQFIIKTFVFICSCWPSYSPVACTLLIEEIIAIRQTKAETHHHHKHLKFSIIWIVLFKIAGHF